MKGGDKIKLKLFRADYKSAALSEYLAAANLQKATTLAEGADSVTFLREVEVLLPEEWER